MSLKIIAKDRYRLEFSRSCNVRDDMESDPELESSDSFGEVTSKYSASQAAEKEWQLFLQSIQREFMDISFLTLLQ